MTAENFDVLIVGAGLSGIGAACHLVDKCPETSFAILESRDSIGGTWDLFRYPGVRSDSDMLTLSYRFRPWLARKSIADGSAILEYIQETAAEYDVEQHVRFGLKVKSAAWSSENCTWTIEADDKATGARKSLTCNFLLVCAGYYSYSAVHNPTFEGRESFSGSIVHPQFWPDDLDYADKRVVVIGSGATAVTLLPELAKKSKHVTMLQRSPGYVVAMPDTDRIAIALRKFLPAKVAYAISRWKNIRFQQFIYAQARKSPDKVRRKLLGLVRRQLSEDFDIERHFNPRYNPWEQRLCLAPNGDFFKALRSGNASVVTDEITCFTESGIRLKSGDDIDADIIVTATGLKLRVLGDIRVSVDNQPVNTADKFSYKAMMFSDVPNMISTFGYLNASWTLRSDLIAEYTCRLLHHMRRTGSRRCTPRLGEAYRDMPAYPWIKDFSSGYFRRAADSLPKQGDRHPWLNVQNYDVDKKIIRNAAIADDALEFRS